MDECGVTRFAQWLPARHASGGIATLLSAHKTEGRRSCLQVITGTEESRWVMERHCGARDRICRRAASRTLAGEPGINILSRDTLRA